MERRRIATLALVSAALPASALAAAQGATTLASVGIHGGTGNAQTSVCSMSADGRCVGMSSTASDLVPHDVNGKEDAFVYDRSTGTMRMLSLSTVDAQGDFHAGLPVLSAGGDHAIFVSYSTTLAPGDTNGFNDAFVRDVTAGVTERVSVSSAGVQGNGNVTSFRNGISADGRYAAFASDASNLVAGDTNFATDVFVRDRLVGTTIRVSVSTAGVEGAGDSGDASDLALTPDGRYVAFRSLAANLVPGDTNGKLDVFVRDLVAGTTVRASLGAGGVQANDASGYPGLTPDGNQVLFTSSASNLVPGDTTPGLDAYVHDLTTGETVRFSVDSAGVKGNQGSISQAISADGRVVCFGSIATNLVPGDTNGVNDAFVHDRVTGITTRVSVSSSGAQASGPNYVSFLACSADGLLVAFDNESPNLVPEDDNDYKDVFVHDRMQPPPTIYCTAKVNSQGCLPSIGSTGAPSATSPAPFDVTAHDVINHKSGVLFYGFAPAGSPFQDGFLCVAAPIQRTAVQSSAGNPGPDDCSGTFALDFNAYVQSGADPFLVAGEVVHCQYWYRDPQIPIGERTGLSDALVFTIGI